VSDYLRTLLHCAAQKMHTQRKLTGACEAMCDVASTAASDLWHRDDWAEEENQMLDAFSRMFSPAIPRGFWFGNHTAQTDLRGRAATKAREHRVYALLLCAEAHEEFL
jgi:hypothetical protein